MFKEDMLKSANQLRRFVDRSVWSLPDAAIESRNQKFGTPGSLSEAEGNTEPGAYRQTGCGPARPNTPPLDRLRSITAPMPMRAFS